MRRPGWLRRAKPVGEVVVERNPWATSGPPLRHLSADDRPNLAALVDPLTRQERYRLMTYYGLTPAEVDQLPVRIARLLIRRQP